MTDEELMRLAIAEAKKSQEKLPCGVVIVKNNKVLAKSFNQQHSVNDATAHAEILAIGKAGKKLGNKDLEDCEIFCTCEPCSMCLSAIIFAKIRRLIYGISLREAVKGKLEIAINTEELLLRIDRKIEVEKEFMKAECQKLYERGKTS